MDYEKIITDGIRYADHYRDVNESINALSDYFKREAKRAERDNFVAVERFFVDCEVRLKEWKSKIIEQLKNDVFQVKHDTNAYICQQRQKDLPISNNLINSLKCLESNTEEQIKEVEKGLSINVYNDINTSSLRYDFSNGVFIYYHEINRLIHSIAMAKEKPTDTNATAKTAAQVTIPDYLLNEMQKRGYIEDKAAKPLKWLETKSLLAYFVDVANEELKLKKGDKRQIRPFETMFNETGLIGCINEYKNKTGQLPHGYKEIDDLFK